MSAQITNRFGKEMLWTDLPTNSRAQFIKGELMRYGLLVIRGVSITTQEYLDLGRNMGAIRPFVDQQYRHPEHPEIFVVSNTKMNGKKIGMDRVGYYWHSDSSFLDNPLPITMLLAQIVPEEGGETAFMDMSEAYDILDDETKTLLKDKFCYHQGKWKYIITEKDLGLSIDEILQKDEAELPAPLHPIVHQHPYIRKTCLYLSHGISRSIVGLEEEGESLIRHIWNEIESKCQRYTHRWQPGDMVLWDNRRMIHRAFPSANGGSRMMFRLGLEDGPFFKAENA